ncbi:MAG: hypothetical protein KDF60_17170 [Calditrichaeota bacterium]|nr:hypothetical protein [Calditrichota bacterium]
MDNINLQELWQQNEKLLNSTRTLNLDLLRTVKLDKAKSSLKNLLFLPASTMIFFIFMASYGLYFSVNYSEAWYFIFSGSVVSFFAILFVLSSIRQLKLILSMDYSAPILSMQKDLTRIKLSIVTNFKITAWLLPFSPFIALFFFKVILDFNLMAVLTINMIITFAFITIALQVIAIFILKSLQPKNINKNWLNWLLQGSGSQIDEAIQFLDEIKEFEKTDSSL